MKLRQLIQDFGRQSRHEKVGALVCFGLAPIVLVLGYGVLGYLLYAGGFIYFLFHELECDE